MSTDMPKISVILPFHNAGKTLQGAVESILNQSFNDWELILVDNASVDSGAEIAQKYARKDPRIILLKEVEKGIVPALRKGYKNSSGDYIARMDADDIAASDRLELQQEFLNKHPNYGLVGSKVRLFPATSKNMGLLRYVNWHNKFLTHNEIRIKSFVDAPVIHPSVMFRRSVVEKHGYLKKGDFPEDYELFLRWLDAGVKFHKLDKILLHWRDSESRLTRTDPRYRKEAFFKVKAKYLPGYLKTHNPCYPKVYLWGAGKNARKWRNILPEDLEIVASFEVDAQKVDNKQILHYSEIPENGGIFILSLVSNQGAGEQIKKHLQFIGYREGKDFILAG